MLLHHCDIFPFTPVPMKFETIHRALSLVAHLVLAFYGTVLMLVAMGFVELFLSIGMNVRIENTPDILGWIQVVVCALIALFFAIRHWRRLPPTPLDAPKSRSQSYLLWGTCAFSLLAIEGFVATYIGCFGHWGWWAGVLFLLIAPIVLAVAWPFRFHAKHNWVYVVTFAGALLLSTLSGCATE